MDTPAIYLLGPLTVLDIAVVGREPFELPMAIGFALVAGLAGGLGLVSFATRARQPVAVRPPVGA